MGCHFAFGKNHLKYHWSLVFIPLDIHWLQLGKERRQRIETKICRDKDIKIMNLFLK
jgi:hypothetical protein